MLPVKCLSSSCYTQIINWRNAEASPVVQVVKIGLTEVATVVLSIAALVECVAYAALLLITAFFTPCSRSPFTLFERLEKSADFTFGWIFKGIFANFTRQPLIASEARMRYVRAQEIFQEIFREEDLRELNEPVNRPGIRLLIDHVFAGMGVGDIQRFRGLEPAIFEFITAKVVFLFTLGALRTEPVDQGCLKLSTQGAIIAARHQFGPDRVPSPELTAIFNSLDLYGTGLPEGHPERPTLQTIIGVSGEELQGGRLLIECLPRALALHS